MTGTTALSHRSLLLVLIALALCSAASVGMVVLRAVYTGRGTYLFMVWNLCLAWIPLLFSLFACRSFARSSRVGVKTLAWSVLWLLFLPNAPYLVTDIQHLHVSRHSPFWFDLILLSSFSLTGLLLGYVSLYTMQEMVNRARGAVMSWLFVLAVLGLSSFGIYLGRYLRWNSWDVLVNPTGIAIDVLERLLFPFDHPGAIGMTFFTTVMLILPYLVLYGLTRIGRRDALQEAEGLGVSVTASATKQ